MRFRNVLLLLVAAALLPDVALAQPADMSGTWILNKKKSSWGSAVQPFDVMMFIEHKEPHLKYKGTITYNDDISRDFSYEGAIDGKPQSADRAHGSGTMTHTRTGPREFKTVFRTGDGSYVQTVDTVLWRNGRGLTRRLRIETPQGVRRWTEVYDKNQPARGRD